MADNGDSSDPMGVLMASGTVRGVCVLKNGEVIFEKFPYSARRLVKVCRVVEGLSKEFRDQGRSVDQMAFGYDGGHLLAVSVRNYRLIVMHLMSDEIDFIATACRAHLEDRIAADGESEKEAESRGRLEQTMPITPKSAEEKAEAGRERVEDTARVEVLSAAPRVEDGDGEMGGLDPDNLSVEDLVG